jgi:hypothetical protein
MPHWRYIAKGRESRTQRSLAMFDLWLAGKSHEQIAQRFETTPSEARRLIGLTIGDLRVARRKWKLAEIRCRALAMELRSLRLGQDCPDRSIVALGPPPRWLKHFKAAGIETVNQLRSVTIEFLLSRPKFPWPAATWAVLRLDELGLSHVLKIRKRIAPRPVKEEVPRCRFCGKAKVARGGYDENGLKVYVCVTCRP